jgi:hypothetical protein
MEYDIVEYKGYLICRNGDLWDIKKSDRIIAFKWTQEECFEFIDKLLLDACNARYPDNPL